MNSARQIVCEEWGKAASEFRSLPGSNIETVIGRILARLDASPPSGELPGVPSLESVLRARLVDGMTIYPTTENRWQVSTRNSDGSWRVTINSDLVAAIRLAVGSLPEKPRFQL